MNRKIRILQIFAFLLFCGIIFITGCKKKNDNSNYDFKYNYYPLDSNHSVTYHVDSISYSYSAPQYFRDTFSYDWRMVIGDTFYDNQNRLNYKIYCYRRADSTQPWNLDRLWSAYRTTTNLQINEDDLRFVKLVFPPSNGQTWNGNVYLPTSTPYDVFLNWNYHYSTIDTSITINGETFDHAIVVGEVDNEDFVNKTLRREIYAKDVGLVYQEWESLEKQNVDTSWATGAESGFRIRWNVIGHNP